MRRLDCEEQSTEGERATHTENSRNPQENSRVLLESEAEYSQCVRRKHLKLSVRAAPDIAQCWG